MRILTLIILGLTLLSLESSAMTFRFDGEEGVHYYLATEAPVRVLDTVFRKNTFIYLGETSGEVVLQNRDITSHNWVVLEKKGYLVESFEWKEYKKGQVVQIPSKELERFRSRKEDDLNFLIGDITIDMGYNWEGNEDGDRSTLYEEPDESESEFISDVESNIRGYLGAMLRRAGYLSYKSEDLSYKVARNISLDIDVREKSSYYYGYYRSYYQIQDVEIRIEDRFGTSMMDVSGYDKDVELLNWIHDEVLGIIGKTGAQIKNKEKLDAYLEENKEKIDELSTTYTPFNEPTTLVTDMQKKVVSVLLEGGHGSGCIVGKEGYVLTNHHVTVDQEDIRVVTHAGDTLDAELVNSKPEIDMALIKVDKAFDFGFKIAPSRSELSPGADVLVIGSPYDLEYKESVSEGYISAMNDLGGIPSYQLAAAVNPGNSGGALVNKNGELIGVINAKLSGYGTKKIGFAIPIELYLENFNLKL